MITILMATYNGEKYVAEQIESVLHQTYTEFQLYIRDDASTDNTLAILKEYQNQYPEKIHVQANEKNTGNAKHNFIKLMIDHHDDYIMLCDQDDVWLGTKIEHTLAKVKEMERQFGTNMPIAVHTDLTIVDESLNILKPSFREASNMNFERTQFHIQLVQAIMTGCTVMYNRALGEYITKEPEYMVMHDWWLMLIASAFGKVGHLDEQTILYRQHSGNAIGAVEVKSLRYRINRVLHRDKVKRDIAESYRQAESFKKMYGSLLEDENRKMLDFYCAIPEHNKIQRVWEIYQLGVVKSGWIHLLSTWLFR